jgi:hypothetical protein
MMSDDRVTDAPTSMIIIWTGRGLWALLILVISLSLPVVAAVLLAQWFPQAAGESLFGLAMASGLAIGGALCWRFGRAWKKDPKLGELHSLYFIPVEYWGVLAIGGAILLIAQQLVF